MSFHLNAQVSGTLVGRQGAALFGLRLSQIFVRRALVTDWLILGRMGVLLYDVPANLCASYDLDRLLSISAE